MIRPLIFAAIVLAAPVRAQWAAPSLFPESSPRPYVFPEETGEGMAPVFSAAGTPSGDALVLWTGRWSGRTDLVASGVSGDDFGSPSPVTASTMFSVLPDLVLDTEGGAHAVWTEATPDLSAFAVAYGYRAPGTAAWSEPMTLSGAGGGTLDAFALASLDGEGTLHVVWVELSQQGAQFAYRQRGTDGTWTDRLPAPAAELPYRPALAAAPDGTLHLLWYDDGAGTPSIRYSAYDAGAWTEPVVLAEGDLSDDVPPLLAIGPTGTLHAMWAEFNVGWFYARKPAGSAWAAPATVPVGGESLVVDAGDRPHVVWEGEDATTGAWGVRYSYADGDEWAPPEFVGPTVLAPYVNAFPELVLSGETLYAFYLVGRGPSGRGYFSTRPLPTATAAEPSEPTPAAPGFTVRPNPASGVVTLQVDVRAAGPVRVEVFDALGRRARTLIHSLSVGTHTLPLDLSSLTPGAYVVRLEAGGHAATRRVTVAR